MLGLIFFGGLFCLTYNAADAEELVLFIDLEEFAVLCAGIVIRTLLNNDKSTFWILVVVLVAALFFAINPEEAHFIEEVVVVARVVAFYLDASSVKPDESFGAHGFFEVFAIRESPTIRTCFLCTFRVVESSIFFAVGFFIVVALAVAFNFEVDVVVHPSVPCDGSHPIFDVFVTRV